ncbi:hypothetical protein BpHYR1_051562 [Brachionus plicatilis]|uniref:Uncharacterized protein n=1 Tax=Brachionus plicatilis TaxID=10195 RepID=A0A3M7RM20_BRAPC|nr:hypothetical protein BpHYR1_051562 [Brachionus plicatilis]
MNIIDLGASVEPSSVSGLSKILKGVHSVLNRKIEIKNPDKIDVVRQRKLRFVWLNGFFERGTNEWLRLLVTDGANVRSIL